MNISIPDIGKYLLLDGFIADIDPDRFDDDITIINQRIDDLINIGFKQIDSYRFISVPFIITSITRIHKSIHHNIVSYSFPKIYNKDNSVGTWNYYYYNILKFDNAILLTDEEVEEVKKNKVRFLQKEGYL